MMIGAGGGTQAGELKESTDSNLKRQDLECHTLWKSFITKHDSSTALGQTAHNLLTWSVDDEPYFPPLQTFKN